MRLPSARQRNYFIVRLLSASLLLFLLYLAHKKYESGHLTSPVRALCINEICTVNPGTETGDDVTYTDYIELYNPTDQTVSLDGLFLTDDADDPFCGALPADEIAPGGYYLIYAAGDGDSVPEGSPSVPFALSEEETITLNQRIETEEGLVSALRLDYVYIPSSISSGAVYARTEDGGSVLSELRPSPGRSNGETSLVLEAPVFLTPSGFYADSVTVALAASSSLSIRYTLDGSEPTAESALYTEPLVLTDQSSAPDQHSSRTDIVFEESNYETPDTPVDKAVIVRAAAFDSEGNYSSTVTASYFLDFDEKEGYEDAYILSLVTDPDNLFSDENGIYVRGSLYEDGLSNGEIYSELSWISLMDYANFYVEGNGSERQAHLTLFDADGTASLDTECGIRIRGNESRSFAQKSFTLYARKRYESDSFAPVLFDTEISYSDLILNNSRTLKKVFFFSLVEDREAAVQQYVPCQVFLNGEYWGMYYLMERYSPEYLEGHYGVDADSSSLIKDTRDVQDGDGETGERFHALRDFLAEEDFSDPEVYAELLEMMDMQSFMDWMCTNIYIANTDTKPFGSNVFTWQAGSSASDEGADYADGRWRWMLYDLDDSLAVGTSYTEGNAYEMDSFIDHAGYSSSGFLDDTPMPALMENEDFCRQFVLTFLDMANENFRADKVSTLLDELLEQYSSMADLSWERWNTSSQYNTFSEQAEELRTFFENRFDYIVPYLAEHFELEGELVNVTLQAETPDGGSVTLNTITPDLSSGDWTGRYYTDYPVTLQAEAMYGYTFAGWELEGGEIVEGDAASGTIQVQLGGDTVIRAVFQKA